MNNNDIIVPGKAVFREIAKPEFARGSAVGHRLKVTLEEHPVKTPFFGMLSAYLRDQDFENKGWYLVNLESPVTVWREPVAQILIFPTGAHEEGQHQAEYDSEGRQISHYYKTPLEDMLLNPKSKILSVFLDIATLLDPAILTEKTLTRDKIRIFPYGEARPP